VSNPVRIVLVVVLAAALFYLVIALGRGFTG